MVTFKPEDYMDRPHLTPPQPRPTLPRRPRTPAQIEASRRNGRLSRGPRTAAGKETSSRNAMKHGVLARKLAPFPAMNEDAEYRHLLAGLNDEYQPRNATERAWVDALAHDMLMLGRAKAMLEAAMTPPTRDGEPVDRRVYSVDQEDRLDVLTDLIIRCANGRRLACPPASLDWVVWRLRDRADVMTENVGNIEVLRAEGQEVGADDEREVADYRRIRPCELLPAVDDELRRLLTGELPVPARDRWTAYLAVVRETQVRHMHGDCPEDGRIRRERGKALDAVSARLPRAEVLLRYEAHYRRAIERTVARLEERVRRRTAG